MEISARAGDDATRSIVLDANELMGEAQALTGLSDFGADTAFLDGLHVLVDAANDMPETPVAVGHVRDRILNCLATRLHLVDDERRHPEIRAIEIERPLVIVGLPRTGTTITFDLLALDANARFPRDWEWCMPWPATEAATIDSDPRIALLQPAFERALGLDPSLAGVHRFNCRAPGECNTGMMYHFAGSNYWAELGVPKHAQWIVDVLPEGLYRDHKRLLQQMSWKGPKGRWLIKSPHHLFDLPSFFKAYPDARVVWLHRDPVNCLASLASLITKIRPACGLPPDPEGVGRIAAALWGKGLLNAVEARARHPEFEDRILDLPQHEIARDPLGAVRTIYDRFDEPLTAGHEARARAFVAGDKDAHRLGKHQHDPGYFGLDPDALRRRLSPYYDRFGEKLERPS